MQSIAASTTNRSVGRTVEGNESIAAYRSALDCTVVLLRTEGPQGLYKGLVANFLRQCPQVVIMWVCYEQYVKLYLSGISLYYRTRDDSSNNVGQQLQHQESRALPEQDPPAQAANITVCSHGNESEQAPKQKWRWTSVLGWIYKPFRGGQPDINCGEIKLH
jgi:hypothetical protein